MQARLSSTRLQQKALLPLREHESSLSLAMQGVYGVADYHLLACDEQSYDTFTPTALEHHFQITAGSLDDVLERFTQALQCIPPVKYVIRATADNTIVGRSLPRLALEYADHRDVDYLCFSGTPHGSGVEVIRYDALLLAHQRASSSYEREHVTPYIYQHPEQFKVENPPAPMQWCAEEIRSTLDTPEDYARLKAFWAEYQGDFDSIIEEYIQWVRRG
nr:spore coat protein [Entomospira entomophilus]